MNTSSCWTWLVIAGIFEIAWASGLKSTLGFTRFWPSVWVLSAMAISMYGLSSAVKGLPVGTAYAVWTGIGAAGTALVGIFVLGEPAIFARIACIFLIIAGTAGLRVFQ
ncbi:MAG TPA: QacE family quaternary ammonium compound efflux SMR transporter [Elusimicrobia bacterium]|nr:QacE family quaternary ammonium compound efflux SMR transporter [Elusimicrobiota bacterium]